jgi:hypothetical protein
MNLYDSTGDQGLLNLWGKLFALANALDGVRTGQVQTACQAVQAVLDLAPEAQSACQYRTRWLAAGGGWQNQIAGAAQTLLMRYVEEKSLPRPSLSRALEMLIEDLRAGGYYFASSARSIQIQSDPANTGDTAIAMTDRGNLGWPCMLLPEELPGQIEGGRLLVQGQARRQTTDAEWPGGSEIALAVPLATPRQSLLENADFESVQTDGGPAGWLVHTGQIGQTIQLTQPEVQELTITGSPTGGYYVLCWTDPAGRQWETKAIAHDASAAAIQSALRTIPGLEAVRVEGTNPFTITWENTPGNIQPLTAINRLSGGSNPQVQITTTQQGDPASYRGRSLRLVGTGSEQTLLWQTIRPSTGVVYGVLARAQRSANAAGALRLELRRGVQDGVLLDGAGGQNRLEVNIANLPTSGHGVISGFFRLRPEEELPVSFVLHLANPLPTGESLYLDELILIPAQRLYAGGPYLAAAAGWKPAEGDRFTITVENDYSGQWEKVLDRFLGLRQQTDLALPTEGTTLIPDSLLE